MSSEIAFSHHYLVEPEKVLTNEVVRRGRRDSRIVRLLLGRGASLYVHFSLWWTFNGYLTVH